MSMKILIQLYQQFVNRTASQNRTMICIPVPVMKRSYHKHRRKY
jgi:hypothetical protein